MEATTVENKVSLASRISSANTPTNMAAMMSIRTATHRGAMPNNCNKCELVSSSSLNLIDGETIYRIFIKNNV